MTSSPYGLYELGYFMRYNGENSGLQASNCKPILKFPRSSDHGLQLARVKSESLVIVDQHATVNLSICFVHTARHSGKVKSWSRSLRFKTTIIF